MHPSHHHPNRNLFNWLIYDQSDLLLISLASHLKGHVLDLGCGNAHYKSFILKHADQYTGVDWSNSLHASGADIISNLNVKIDTPDSCADTLFSISVLEHLHDPKQFAVECFRILKNGGYFVLQVPFQWQIHEAPFDFHRFTPFGLRKLFETVGFEVKGVFPTGGFFITLAMKTCYFLQRISEGAGLKFRVFRLAAIIACQILQWSAKLLDPLDKTPELEASGYFLLACKPTTAT